MELVTAKNGMIDSRKAMEYLKDKVIDTPIRRLHWLEKYAGVPVYGKLENYQYAGSFKYRGARYRLRNQPKSKTVIAASAGNHGFAVAYASQELGLKTNICLPTTASRIKREHIVNTGVGLIEFGNSLDEAVDYSIGLAKERDWTFVSPYNDPDIISANGTISIDLFEHIPGLQSIIVPVGGGGLISGMAIAAKSYNNAVKVFGCEPGRYNTLTKSLNKGRITKIVHQPTIADGLAVNLEDDSITFELVKKHVGRIVELSEEELSAATLSLLIHESLLVEPAGAAGIIACIKLAQEEKLTGPVAIPLCGGNLHHTTLAKIQRYPYEDPLLQSLLNIKGPRLVDIPVKKVYLEQTKTNEADQLFDPIDYIVQNLKKCFQLLTQSIRQIDDYLEYCKINEIYVDEAIINGAREKAAEVCDMVNDKIYCCERLGERGDHDKELVHGESIIRLALHTVNFIKGVFEWCAPSYAQSRVSQFFDIGSQENPSVNYERYESTEVQRVESQLLELMGLDSEKYSITATSSGMAAYALIEAFILREKVKPDSTILLSPYIYFEASEQITSLKWLNCVFSPSYEVSVLTDMVLKHKPDVMFLDPLTNNTEQRLIDIGSLLDNLAGTIQHNITIVVDGTMLSAALDKTWFNKSERIELIYYESCSKYIQLGLDLSMAGFIAHPVEKQALFNRLRRNSGAILSRQGANLFPAYPAELYKRRLKKIATNAEKIAGKLIGETRLKDIVKIYYPGHKSHKDHAIAAKLAYAGGCVTFRLLHPGENHRDQLESLIEKVILSAKTVGLYITKGVSFGYSVPRISAASSMAEYELPFLRLYAGCLSNKQVEMLIHILKEVLLTSGR